MRCDAATDEGLPLASDNYVHYSEGLDENIFIWAQSNAPDHCDANPGCPDVTNEEALVYYPDFQQEPPGGQVDVHTVTYPLVTNPDFPAETHPEVVPAVTNPNVSDLEGIAEQSMYLALANTIVTGASMVFNGLAFIKYLKSGNKLKKFNPNSSADMIDAEKGNLYMATNQYATAGALSVAGSLIGSVAAWSIREQLDNKK